MRTTHPRISLAVLRPLMAPSRPSSHWPEPQILLAASKLLISRTLNPLQSMFLTLAYRYRRAGKFAVAALVRVLPLALSRRLRSLAEQVAFRAQPDYQGETLPPIFHYWASRHLGPLALELGISSPEQFFFAEICSRAAVAPSRRLRVVSLGSGTCAMEVALVRRLVDSGIAVDCLCIDFNSESLRHAAHHAESCGVSAHMEFAAHDCNKLPRLPASDVLIVNQFFHHVEDLEPFCRALNDCLESGGKLLTSDIIGRNGHLLWPDVEAATLAFWGELPAEKRVDRYFGKVQREYIPIDHSQYSNEGIRSQEVVGCLLRHFDFELFFTFGGCIIPFVERRIGFNFNPESPSDQAFIDRIHARDSTAMANRSYPASNMIASLRRKGLAERRVFDPISPEEHVQLSLIQQAKCGSG